MLCAVLGAVSLSVVARKNSADANAAASRVIADKALAALEAQDSLITSRNTQLAVARATLDSLQLVVRRAAVQAPVRIYVASPVDSSDFASLRFALIERTAQLDTAIVERDAARAQVLAVSGAAELVIRNYGAQLTLDSAESAALRKSNEQLQADVKAMARLSRRTFWQQSASVAKQVAVATVIALAVTAKR